MIVNRNSMMAKKVWLPNKGSRAAVARQSDGSYRRQNCAKTKKNILGVKAVSEDVVHSAKV